MKICSKCMIEKPLSDFANDKKVKSGKGSICKVCIARINKKWRENRSNKQIKKDREAIKKSMAKWRKNNPEEYLRRSRESDKRRQIKKKNRTASEKLLDSIKEKKRRDDFKLNNPEKYKERRKKDNECHARLRKENPSNSSKMRERRLAAMSEDEKKKIKFKNKVRSRRKYLKSRAHVLKRTAENQKRHIEELTDTYLKSLLCNRTKLNKEDIPKELVDLKRIQLKIHRELN